MQKPCGNPSNSRGRSAKDRPGDGAAQKLRWAALILIAVGSIARADEISEIEHDEQLFRIPWHLSADDERGEASWYDAGSRTANGERFPSKEMTCAHPSLPFGTIVRVTRVDTRRSIRCRINDRGPFTDGRIIDLSPKAALGLDLKGVGHAQVIVERIGESQILDQSKPVASVRRSGVRHGPVRSHRPRSRRR